MSTLLKVNSKRFVQETIDGETIVMDTVSGRLLLLRETAALLLSALATGLPSELLLEEIAGRYGEQARTQARDFVTRLSELDVLAAVDSPAAGVVTNSAGGVVWPSNFVSPVVELYDDIAEIITMDPIHDVDEDCGWPRAAAAPRE